MKECPKCIGFGMDTDNFCSICGTKLKKVKNDVCECGKKIYPSVKFCSQCGKKIDKK